MKILDKFKATLKSLFRRPPGVGHFTFDWGTPKGAQDAVPGPQGTFPEARRHPPSPARPLYPPQAQGRKPVPAETCGRGMNTNSPAGGGDVTPAGDDGSHICGAIHPDPSHGAVERITGPTKAPARHRPAGPRDGLLP